MERAGGLEDVTVVYVPSPSMDFLACNLERPFLQNQMVRQAMMHAIDREGIVASVLQGEGTVVNSSIFGPDWMGVPEGLEPLRVRSRQGKGDCSMNRDSTRASRSRS